LEFKEFKNQINYLNSKFNIIDYYQLRDFILNKKELPQNPCILTFDDGYKDHIEYVLPELLKRKISGFFFPVGSTVMEKKF
jgi:peptidoglycan/xylan/chitin deacetylase (PgdA/CDA1 family)